MPRPKAVLFDLGKVLVDFDWLIAARRISADAQTTAESLVAFIMSSDLMVNLEKGWLSNDAFFDAVRSRIRYQKSQTDFQLAFSDIFREIPEMVNLHQRVRAAGLTTWIFSNTNDWAVTHIRSTFPFFSTFDGYFLSYELGLMKPEPGIYEVAETRTGLSGRDILYIDDVAENVAGGAEREWQVIQHHTPEMTVLEVERILSGA
jgi:putative hydrolase of the HAD superfamily